MAMSEDERKLIEAIERLEEMTAANIERMDQLIAKMELLADLRHRQHMWETYEAVPPGISTTRG